MLTPAWAERPDSLPALGCSAGRRLQRARYLRRPDGLRHTSPAPLTWEINKVLLDDVITVTDDDIVGPMRRAFEYLKIVAEPSGAVALAALAAIGLPAGPAGVVISGGSVDYGTFRALIAGFPDAAAPLPDQIGRAHV